MGTLSWCYDNRAFDALLEVPDDTHLRVMRAPPVVKKVVVKWSEFLDKIKTRVLLVHLSQDTNIYKKIIS